MINRLDHIVFGALDLHTGTQAIELRANTVIPPGGKHPLMGTHNSVVSTAAEEFLEVIAIDPQAAPVLRKRWFSLDEPATHARLKTGARPLCWVVNTTDIETLVGQSPVDLGDIIEVTRGDLTWRLTVPASGQLPLSGVLPAFIEWPGSHPARDMQPSGVSVSSINLTHPAPDDINAVFAQLSIDHLAKVTAHPKPTIGFALTTPTGRVVTFD